MKNPPLLLALLVAGTRGLWANDTSLHDGRFGPTPLSGRESPVRMVAEHIEVRFGYRESEVHCTFTFRNPRKQGIVEELVGFPDVGAAKDEIVRRHPEKKDLVSEFVNTARLSDMVTLVNGGRVKSEVKFEDLKNVDDGDSTTVWMPAASEDSRAREGVRAWHVVRAKFPAGKNVTVERLYKAPNGTSALGVCFFNYTTSTGAPWKGTIGRMQTDVTLCDDITVDQLVWPGTPKLAKHLLPKMGTWPPRKEWRVIDEHHLRLVWTDFEPRTQEDRRGFSLSRDFHGW